MATDAPTRRAAVMVAALGALAATTSSAGAQPGLTVPSTDPVAPADPALEQAAPAPRPLRVHLAVSTGVGITSLDGHAATATAQLDDYGWVSARAPVMYGFGVEAQYLLAPLVDLGAVYHWSRGDLARGLTADDLVRSDVTRLGAVARLHWAQGRPLVPEPRVELGVVRERLVVHHQPDQRTLGYLRAGVDWRLGTRRVGVQLAIGYTITSRAEAGQLDPAVGGLDLSAGPYFRF